MHPQPPSSLSTKLPNLLHLTILILSLDTFNTKCEATSTSTSTSENNKARTEELMGKWGTDWAFTGISSFAHLPYTKCLTDPDVNYDIAIIGAPFDTSVSYRPGARLGPRALRAASARQVQFRGYNPRARLSPYNNWAKIVDCGDIPATPFDNALALRQLTEAYLELGSRPSVQQSVSSKPKLISLGGDHSIALPALRALNKIYGREIAVLHFDAHLDTWHPGKYPSHWLKEEDVLHEQSSFNHGSMFWIAWREGLISRSGRQNTSSSSRTAENAPPNVHAGLRTRLLGEEDNEDDTAQGWVRIESDAISPDILGPLGVAELIMSTIGTETPVYLSVDIDVIDPGLAPGTGTPEAGGWTTRELIRVLRAISELNVVGADLVEVSPPFDGRGEQTALAGAQVVYEMLTSLVGKGLKDVQEGSDGKAGQDVKDEL